MSRLGERLAGMLAAGDCIGLQAPSVRVNQPLARAMITAALASQGIEAGDVSSPTFTLFSPILFLPPMIRAGKSGISTCGVWKTPKT